MIKLIDNKKVLIYCRVGNEEQTNLSYNIELENILKKYINDFKMPDMFKSKNCYIPYQGYYDLREYNLAEKEFIDFWKTQYLLKCCEKNKETIKSIDNNDFERLKEISCIYQSKLFEKELKDKEIELDY